MEEAMAEDLLTQFEVDMGLKTPETADIKREVEKLGPEENTEHTEAKESEEQKTS
jgi:hypothetical protein